MKIRMLTYLGLTLVFLLSTSISTRAQGRFEITPFAGYETSGSYPISVFANNGDVVAPVNKLRVNDALSYGTFLGFNLTENAQIEFMWDRNNTSYSARNALTGEYFKAYDSDIDQYQFGDCTCFATASTACVLMSQPAWDSRMTLIQTALPIERSLPTVWVEA